MISPYLCTDSHGVNSISLVPVYSAETRPIEKIGCDDCLSSLDAVDTLIIGRFDADSRSGRGPCPNRPEELQFKQFDLVHILVCSVTIYHIRFVISIRRATQFCFLHCRIRTLYSVYIGKRDFLHDRIWHDCKYTIKSYLHIFGSISFSVPPCKSPI